METLTLLASMLIVLPAFAGIKLPSKVFEVKDLEKAKAEAVAKGKPISVLYTDKDSTCPLCNNAAEKMIKELGSKTVMGYEPQLGQLPRNVWGAFNEGRFIPKVAVFDSSMERHLGLVTYEAVKEDDRDAFRNVERAIRDYSKR